MAIPKITLTAGTSPTEGTIGTYFISLDTPAPAGGLTVAYNTTGSTAKLNSHYQLTAGENLTAVTDSQFTIVAGAKTATLKLVAVADTVVASSKTVRVNVIAGADYDVGGENSNVVFAANTDFTVGDYPGSVISADFNGDGNADVATAKMNSHNVSVLLGNGTGGFAAKTDFTVGSTPVSVISADFNGDGKTDLATANSYNTVSVRLNHVNIITVTLTVAQVTNGNDLIKGTATADRIDGLKGNDSILGFAGNDTLSGSAGNDVLNAGVGNDSLSGATGNDTLIGDVGNDTLNGGTGNDNLKGGGGNDTYVVDSRSDVITEGNTWQGGIDTVNSSVSYSLADKPGKAGVENLILTGIAKINGTGNALNNQLTGNKSNNLLFGGEGLDTLTGGEGNDTLDGGNGNDTLDGGLGSNRINGGAGVDVALFGGKKSDYSLTQDSTDNAINVKDTQTGTISKLRDIEMIKFADDSLDISNGLSNTPIVNHSIVVFDLVGGTSSSHSNRTFDVNTSYTIYVRVSSTDVDLYTDAHSGHGTFGVWTGAKNLGADDVIVLVGNDPSSDVIGISSIKVDSVNNGPGFVIWGGLGPYYAYGGGSTSGTSFCPAARLDAGLFNRFTGINSDSRYRSDSRSSTSTQLSKYI